MEILIFYTKIETPLPEVFRSSFLAECPVKIVSKNSRYVRWQDRDANIAGLYLLVEAMKHAGYQGYVLNNLRYTDYGRPYLSDGPDFSISHAGEFVVCAIAPNGARLGVDIEHIRPVDHDSLTGIMNENELEKMRNSEDQMTMFYEFWTMKESVIKADGRGLSIPLTEVSGDNNTVTYEGIQWSVFQPFFKPNYSFSLAVNVPGCKLNWRFSPANEWFKVWVKEC